MEEYWPWLAALDDVPAWGPYSWTLQTYLYLARAGAPCTLVHEVPAHGVLLAHRDFLPDDVRPGPDLYVACILADREQPGFIGHHPWAQFHVVQNPEDPKLALPNGGWPAAFVPYWPQPNLIQRRPDRGDQFETAAFFGYEHNLAHELRSTAWTAALEALGLRWVVPQRSHWNDYAEVDVIVAARSFDPSASFTYKPPSKLHNAWRAGVPAILGRESAYRAWRQDPLDYLEVTSFDDALGALRRLRDDAELRRRMIRHGIERAKEVSPARLVARWQQILEELEHRWRSWRAMSNRERDAFFAERGTADKVPAWRRSPAPPIVEVDILVIGSGFAAYEVTRAAVARGRTVAVLERGPESPTLVGAEASRVPYRREAIVSGGSAFGARVAPEFDFLPRYVGLGGTSYLWSGKWRRLDPIDLSRTMHGRSWPITYDELQRWSDAVARDYGWPHWSDGAELKAVATMAAKHGLRLVEIYDQEQPERLSSRWSEIRQTGRVALTCGVSGIEPLWEEAGERLSGVRAETVEREFLVAAQQVVIACGGIASVWMGYALRDGGRRVRRPFAPPSHSYGGFMDHPKAVVGEVRPRRGSEFAFHLQELHRTQRRLFALSLPEDELRRRGLGNHALFLWRPADSPPTAPFRLTLSLEQFPEPDNVVMCHPSPAVVWRVSRQTRANGLAFLDVMQPRLRQLVGPVSRLTDLQWSGASHHAGALPMGEPEIGVVDPDARFHDVANLYCASSAVFPTAGSANPTLTVAALARRLGEHLASGGYTSLS